MGFSCRVLGTILSSLLFFVTSASLFSHAANILTQGQSIKDGQTLVSDGKFFELGFFSPGNSTNRYVGIWYHNLVSQTVVWVANRERSVTDSSGSFTIGRDGNLQVLDGKGNIIWSSNSPTVSKNSSAQLLDSGNLVLRSSDGSSSPGNFLWESFNHPTDTILPGMKISMEQKTGKSLIFTSWKGPSDPSMGKYSLGIDPHGSPQIFIWEGSMRPRWRTGEWNGQTFIGTGLRPLYLYGFKLINDAVEEKMYFIFTEFNGSHYRFVLQWDGIEAASVLVEETKKWKNFWSQPVTECEIYNKCGNNAKCGDNGNPICSCLRGYNPKSTEEWSKGNWSSGCIRRTPLNCESSSSRASDAKEGKRDGFLKLEALKLPDLSEWAPTAGDDISCEDYCVHNCSCKAYAFLSGIGCMIWGGDLVDINQFSHGGFELYVKLAPSELLEKSKTWLIIVVTSIVVVVILIISFFLWWKCTEKIKDFWKKGSKRESSSVDLNSSIKFLSEFSSANELGEDAREGKGPEFQLFNFDCIAAATDNFKDSSKLGEGGFGTVYKGLLGGGQEIAVKRLSRTSGQGQEEFKNEVILIAKLQHRNLVRLMGCCIKGEEKLLVYEYMPNNSLDAILFNPAKQALLDWRKRFNIIEGIARGLLYLHQDSRLRIVHRDLKAANILLDEEMNPRISDFGMARIFGGNQNQANTNRVVGTYGYMSPEYAMEGLFSIKSDVYSFGVIVLEIVSGLKNNSFQFSENCRNLIGHAWQLWKDDKAPELIDPSISSSVSSDEVMRCIQVALLCVQDRANDRPTMSSVIFMLGSETPTHSMPKQPSFTLEGSCGETGSLETDHDSFSNLNEPITVVSAR